MYLCWYIIICVTFWRQIVQIWICLCFYIFLESKNILYYFSWAGCFIFATEYAISIFVVAVARVHWNIHLTTLNLPFQYLLIHTSLGNIFIDENLPDLSGILEFSFARFLFSGYGHRHISGSLNFIKIIFRICLARPFTSMYISGHWIKKTPSYHHPS